MNNDQNNDKLAFVITVEDIQEESIRLIGRILTDEELYDAIKGVNWGLSTGIDIVFRAAIDEAVAINSKA